MLPLYLNIREWQWIFGRAVEAILWPGSVVCAHEFTITGFNCFMSCLGMHCKLNYYTDKKNQKKSNVTKQKVAKSSLS